jgi:hypothetical protein
MDPQCLALWKKLWELLELPELPPQCKKYHWMMTLLQQFLIACGVNDWLTDSDVQCILRAKASVGLVAERYWKNEWYYHLDPLMNESPKDQQKMPI